MLQRLRCLRQTSQIRCLMDFLIFLRNFFRTESVFLSSILAGILLVAPFQVASAVTIVSQQVEDGTYQNKLEDGGAFGLHQQLGTGISGTVTSIIFRAFSTSSLTVRVKLFESSSVPNEQCSGCTLVFNGTATLSGSMQTIQVSTSSPPILNSSIDLLEI